MSPFAFGVGLIAGACSFFGLWAMAQLLVRSFHPPDRRRISPLLVAIAISVKLGGLAGGWVICNPLGRPGHVGFAAGIVLVYCLAVAGIAWKTPPDRPPGKWTS